MLLGIVAVLMITMVCLGLYMTNIPVSLLKLELFGWHKQLGVLVLMLFFVTYHLRLQNLTPSLPASLPKIQKNCCARCTFFTVFIYVFTADNRLANEFCSGWAFCFFLWAIHSTQPDFTNASYQASLAEIHEWLAYSFYCDFISAYCCCTLKHHFVNHDNILRRMLWPK